MSETVVPLNIAPKTSAAVAAGGVSIAIVSVLAWALSFAHITIPPDVAVAFSTIFTGVASWYAPRQHQQIEPQEQLKP